MSAFGQPKRAETYRQVRRWIKDRYRDQEESNMLSAWDAMNSGTMTLRQRDYLWPRLQDQAIRSKTRQRIKNDLGKVQLLRDDGRPADEAARSTPTQAPPPSVGGDRPEWWAAPPVIRDKGTSQQDWMEQYVYNQLIPTLDPVTQRSTALWLSRDNPDQYGIYKDIDPAQGQALRGTKVGDYLDPQRIGNIISAVDYDTIAKNLPSSVKGFDPGKDENKQAVMDVKSGLRWLTEALKTAQKGVGGTRAEQAWAGKHLNTLMGEAQQEPHRAGKYSTLFENIVNPVVERAPTEGVFGRNRALKTPSGDFNRRGVYRNPKLT